MRSLLHSRLLPCLLAILSACVTARPSPESTAPPSTPSAEDPEADLRGRMAEAQRQLAQWRGLEFVRPVKLATVPAEGHTGLGGWYEPGADRLVVVEGRTAAFSRAVLLHELYHALQDQHFDLAGLIEATPPGDPTLALQAMIEGEAMLAVTDILDYDFDRHAVVPPTGEVRRSQLESIYRYGDGRRFVLALRERGGWDSVDAAYARPPRSSAEILHPERYPALAAPPLPSFEEPGSASPEALREARRRGEIELCWLLITHEPSRAQASEIAASLENDRAGSLEQEGGGERELWDLRFVDAPSAERFARTGAAQAQGWTLRREGRDVRLSREPSPT